jgi:hypothetical protein
VSNGRPTLDFCAMVKRANFGSRRRLNNPRLMASSRLMIGAAAIIAENRRDAIWMLMMTRLSVGSGCDRKERDSRQN